MKRIGEFANGVSELQAAAIPRIAFDIKDNMSSGGIASTGSTRDIEKTGRTKERELALISLFGPERAGSSIKMTADVRGFTSLLGHTNPFRGAFSNTTQLNETMRMMHILSGSPKALRVPGTIMDEELVAAARAISEMGLSPEVPDNAVKVVIEQGNLIGRRVHGIITETTQRATHVKEGLADIEERTRLLAWPDEPIENADYITEAEALVDSLEDLVPQVPGTSIVGDITSLLSVEKEALKTHAFILGSERRPDLRLQYEETIGLIDTDVNHVELRARIASLVIKKRKVKNAHRRKEWDKDNTAARALADDRKGIIPRGERAFTSLREPVLTRANETTRALYNSLSQMKQELNEAEDRPIEQRVLAEELIALQAIQLLPRVNTLDDITGADVRKLMEKQLRRRRPGRTDKVAVVGTTMDKPSGENESFEDACTITRDILTARFDSGSVHRERATRLQRLEENEIFQRRARSALGPLVRPDETSVIGPVGRGILTAIAGGHHISTSDIDAMQLTVDEFAAHARGEHRENVIALRENNRDSFRAIADRLGNTTDMRNAIDRLGEIITSHSVMQDIAEVLVGENAELGDSYRMEQRIRSEIRRLQEYQELPARYKEQIRTIVDFQRDPRPPRGVTIRLLED